MTTSPYDNLPIGSTEEKTPEERLQETPREHPQQLTYVDVPVEDAAEPTEMIKPAAPATIPQASNVPEPPRPSKPSAAPASPAPQGQGQHSAAPQPFSKITPFQKAPQYTKRSIKNLWDVKEYILPFEESLLVPDTMPDMAKALFAEGRVTQDRSAKAAYEKDSFISGSITVYTVYHPVSADSPVDVVKSTISFKTDKCWGQAEGDSFRVRVSIRDMSVEMVNERKFTVTGNLLIQFTEIANKDLMVYAGSEDTDLVVSQSAIQMTELDFEAEETTEISQDINIREDQPAPVKILKESIDIIETHKQITSGKLVINATIRSQILYVGEEDGERKLACLSNKTDFTQFLQIKENLDASLVRTSFIGNDLKITIENQNQFLLQGKVTTLIQGYQNREAPIISDAYHKTMDIRFDSNSQPLSHVKGTVCGEISAREVIDQTPDRKPQTFLCGSCGIPSIEKRPERGRVVIEGVLPVKILALDEEGVPFLIQHELPLRGSLDMAATTQNLRVFTSAALKDFWFDEINSRQVEINASLSIEAWCCGTELFHTLENFGIIEGKDPAKRVAMALYVTGNGDTLWDVAKRYKCDMSALAELNQIEPQHPLPEGMKLLITS